MDKTKTVKTRKTPTPAFAVISFLVIVAVLVALINLGVDTTMSVFILNKTGLKVAQDIGTQYLLSDFKKKEGYKRSIELSKEYNLYRQNYCGCVYSKREEK